MMRRYARSPDCEMSSASSQESSTRETTMWWGSVCVCVCVCVCSAVSLSLSSFIFQSCSVFLWCWQTRTNLFCFLVSSRPPPPGEQREFMILNSPSVPKLNPQHAALRITPHNWRKTNVSLLISKVSNEASFSESSEHSWWCLSPNDVIDKYVWISERELFRLCVFCFDLLWLSFVCGSAFVWSVSVNFKSCFKTRKANFDNIHQQPVRGSASHTKYMFYIMSESQHDAYNMMQYNMSSYSYIQWYIMTIIVQKYPNFWLLVIWQLFFFFVIGLPPEFQTRT